MKTDDLVKELNKNITLILPEKISPEDLQLQLALYINNLIQTDFQKLIVLLYRIDVSESKLKKLLQHHAGEDAGKIIAALVIERQLQKIHSRRQYSRQDDNFTEEEKW